MQRTKEDIGEQIILEQLLRIFSDNVCTWVKEHKPTGQPAPKLAHGYLNTQKEDQASYQEGSCPQHASPLKSSNRASTTQLPGQLHPAATQRGVGKDLVCFYCQQAGHKAYLRPIRKAKHAVLHDLRK